MSLVRSQRRNFPSTWEVVPFEEAFEDATGGNAKVQTRDYQTKGILRVIDQGQSVVAGYVNDPALACRAPLPSILFGDHTRIFKFADAPFALGADGVKVLVPRAGLDAKFAFHFLRTVRLPQDLGYSRHFRHLREAQIPRPPLAEQKRIANILDRTDAIRFKRSEAVEATECLLRSIFLEMFGDPVTNPKEWDEAPLSSLGRITTGNTPSRAVSEYYGDHIEWIKSDNINTPSHLLTRAAESLSREGRAQGRTAPSGSTLITCIAGSPDCIGNVALADREVAFNQQINAVTPRGGVDHRYLYALLLVGKRIVQAASTKSMKGMVSKGRLEGVRVPFPPSTIQAEFGVAFDRVLGLSRNQEAACAESDRLFEAMLGNVFGEPPRVGAGTSDDERTA